MSALSFRRFAAVWALVLSGGLIVFAFFMDPDIGAEGRELARSYAESPERIQLSAHGLRLAFALLIVPVFVLISMIRERGAWLANTAGILAVLGMTTMPGLLVVDFFDVAIYSELGGDAWQAVSDHLEELPGMVIMFVSAFIPFLLALPLILVAAWRGGLLSWWPGVLALAGAVAAQAVPGGIGLLVEAGVLIFLGYVLARMFRARPIEQP
ncbi:hypothetical protein BH23ACT12_BH23ACT12_22080 [soil metagenome]